MSDTLKIAQADTRTKPVRMPQDQRSGSRPTSRSNQLRARVSSRDFQWPQPTRTLFAPTKRAWTLTSLWTQRTRPQVTLKTADSFQQRPHPIFLSSKKKEGTKNGRQEIA